MFPGQVDDEGRVEFSDEASAKCYGVVDEIAAAQCQVAGCSVCVAPMCRAREASTAILRYPF